MCDDEFIWLPELFEELKQENTRLKEQMEQTQAEAAALRRAAEIGLNYAKKHTKHDEQTEAEDVCIDIHEILNNTTAGREYAERVRKLETVAKAAKNFLRYHKNMECFGTVAKLKQTLAVLEVPDDGMRD